MANSEVNDFPDPTLAAPDTDLIAISAFDSAGNLLEINPEIEWPKLTFFGSSWNSDVLLAAYRAGMFPMPYEISGRDQAIGWWSPQERAIFRPRDVVVSTSLSRAIRQFTVTMDLRFESVIQACGDPARPSGWINQEVIDSFCGLHDQGIAHSVEVWNLAGQLVGGLYGLDLGGVFAAESMFHLESNASKVALAYLGQRLDDGSGRIIDTQWQSNHLASMGATTMSRARYCALLPELLLLPPAFAKNT
jgi:leucyl/phenylalanyl-tRNA--protein transferase